MDYAEMIRALTALSPPRFNLSTNDGGRYGTVQGGAEIPVGQDGQLFAQGSMSPTNLNAPGRNLDFGAFAGYRKRF